MSTASRDARILTVATLDRLPLDAYRRYGPASMAVDDRHGLTYEDLHVQSLQLAAALEGAGVRKGTRVAIWMTNRVEWLVAQFAVYRAGAVLVPINPQFKAVEVAHILSDSHADLLIYEPIFLDRYNARRTLEDARALCRKDVLRLGTICVGEPASGERQFELTQNISASDCISDALLPTDVCQIMYTSGTTGTPKGVQLTSEGLLTTYRAVATNLALQAGKSTWLLSLPLSTMFGCAAVVIPTLLMGGRIVLRPRFDPRDSLAVVKARGVTHLTGSPAMYQMLMEAGLSKRAGQLRGGIIAGAVAPPELLRALIDGGPLPDLVNMFGQTEGCGTATMTTCDDPLDKRLTTVGRPLPHVDLRIARLQGSGWCEPGGLGEVCGRGKYEGVHTFAGYTNRPVGDDLDAEGWLHYGDVGSLDAEGYLSVGLGRLKEMYVSGGYNVYPPEVENILLRHPAIELVAVIGVPDARLGEAGVAFLRLRRGHHGVDPESIREWCLDNLAHYKVPAKFNIVSALPTTASGKVKRSDLKRAWLQGERGE